MYKIKLTKVEIVSFTTQNKWQNKILKKQSKNKHYE